MKTILQSQWLLSLVALLGLISVIFLPSALSQFADQLSAKENAHTLNDPNCVPNGGDYICDLGSDAIATGRACIPICVPLFYIPALIVANSLKQRLRNQEYSVRLWQTLGSIVGAFTLGYILLAALIILVY